MDDKFLTQRIVKAFRHIPPLELPDAPVHAIKGLSQHDGELLYDSFWVKTIRDLADLRFVHWAQEICALRDVPQEKIDMYGFQDKLNKAYEQTPIRTLMKSSVDVLQGLSEDDARRLEEAFKVRTVEDLANLKFARYAQEICREAYGDLSAPIRSQNESPRSAESRDSGERKPGFARFIAMVLTIIALLLLAYWAPICFPPEGPPILEESQATETVEKQASEEDPRGEKNQSRTEEGRGTDAESSLRRGTYFVQDGDTLYEISKRLYGSPHRWQDIYRANSDRIESADDIFPGDELKLPR